MKEYLDVLKKYATFSGRARRKEYWMYQLINILIFIGLWLFLMVNLDWAVILAGLYILAVLIPGLAVTVRRLHDTGRSGWWFFINFVPMVGSIILIVFMCLDSSEGDNKYGPNPKGVVASAVPSATPVQAAVAPAPAPAPVMEAPVATTDVPPQA